MSLVLPTPESPARATSDGRPRPPRRAQSRSSLSSASRPTRRSLVTRAAITPVWRRGRAPTAARISSRGAAALRPAAPRPAHGRAAGGLQALRAHLQQLDGARRRGERVGDDGAVLEGQRGDRLAVDQREQDVPLRRRPRVERREARDGDLVVLARRAAARPAPRGRRAAGPPARGGPAAPSCATCARSRPRWMWRSECMRSCSASGGPRTSGGWSRLRARGPYLRARTP